MLALDVVDREGNRVTHALGPGRHVLGKSPECDLVVSDPHVSRRHLEIVVEAGAATVADLGSTNGTWIGARRIEAPERLSPPSELRAGTLRLIVRPQPAPNGAGDGAAAHAGAGTDGAMDALKRSLHARLVEDLDLRRRAVLERLPEEALRREARAAAERLLPELAPALGEGPARERLVAEVVAEAIGLGPLEPLMEDPSVTEIMVNG
ncbi:MAG TPA: FHA domain-containing protein, partial [Chromatiales bacterium]|nr:FHA domain-containing protein [Chromatiales bacterium]